MAELLLHLFNVKYYSIDINNTIKYFFHAKINLSCRTCDSVMKTQSKICAI